MSTSRLTAAAKTASPDILASGAEALDRVRALAPRIAERAGQTEADRRIPEETISELVGAGLFGIVTPRSNGGSELGFADLVAVTAEVAEACGSTGWVYGVLAGHSWLLNLFPAEAQMEVFGDPTALTATVFRLGGTVVEVEGGYRLTGGEGRFCSGIDYASWVIVGNAVKKADGSVEPRFFNIPKRDIEVVDDWFTTGMRGTGSRSIRIKDAFIPAHRSCALQDMLGGTSPGAAMHVRAVYRMPFADIAPFSIVGAPIGMARGAVKNFASHTGPQLSGADELTVAEQTPKLARLGEAAAAVDAALALVVADAARIDAARSPNDLSALDRARIPRDWAWAAQTARNAVSRLFEVAGGSTIYDGDALQRIWRDVNSATQHFAFSWDSAMPNYGRAAAGLKPARFALKGRK